MILKLINVFLKILSFEGLKQLEGFFLFQWVEQIPKRKKQ